MTTAKVFRKEEVVLRGATVPSDHYKCMKKNGVKKIYCL
jgi:hypothetical protein